MGRPSSIEILGTDVWLIPISVKIVSYKSVKIVSQQIFLLSTLSDTALNITFTVPMVSTSVFSWINYVGYIALIFVYHTLSSDYPIQYKLSVDKTIRLPYTIVNPLRCQLNCLKPSTNIAKVAYTFTALYVINSWTWASHFINGDRTGLYLVYGHECIMILMGISYGGYFTDLYLVCGHTDRKCMLLCISPIHASKKVRYVPYKHCSLGEVLG